MIHSFRGDSKEGHHLDVDKVKAQLNLTPDDMTRFMQTIAESEDTVCDILGTLTRDAWPQKAQMRAPRCTGAAIQVAVSLMESVAQGQSGRIMVFSGGAASCGP